ncbi:MAG: RNA polymerase sporulation sigma factor SigG [Ruminococcaceae bacterium]|nr:RNA polymerase sporulation sigma factor SigG [Oscillospiraceae bacterium]
MYYNKVEICGVNTSELGLIDDERKRHLLERMKQGDNGARDELIRGNLRLVLSIIKRFCGKKESADDLFQVGCLGLIKAIDNFKTELDVKFSTYAVPMIIGEIRRYLRDNTAIRISRSIRDLAYRALQIKEEMLWERESEPSIDEIAKKLDCAKEDVSRAMEAIVDPVSIYEPVYNDGGESLYVIDRLADTSTTDDGWLESIALQNALSMLSKRERDIINMRYFEDLTQTEVAKKIGISQAQISRIEKTALKKMKKYMV